MDGNREGSEHSADLDKRADAYHNRSSPRPLFLGFRFLQAALQALPLLAWSCLQCAISDGGLMEVFWGWLVFAADGGDGFGGEFFANGADTVAEGAAFLAVH